MKKGRFYNDPEMVRVQRLIEVATEKAGSRTALARKLDCAPGAIINWERSVSLPGAKLLSRLEAAAGVDSGKSPVINEPGSVYASPSQLRVVGRVAAGRLSQPGADKNNPIDGITGDAFKTSRYWTLTQGEVVLVEVDGDSMEPLYHCGDYLACRAPSSVRDLPDGTPCTFLYDGECTFKLLRRAAGLVLGIPINPRYEPVVMKGNRQPDIQYVVLGKFSVEKKK